VQTKHTLHLLLTIVDLIYFVLRVFGRYRVRLFVLADALPKVDLLKGTCVVKCTKFDLAMSGILITSLKDACTAKRGNRVSIIFCI